MRENITPSIKPAWYRVSVKALIRDKENRILFMGEGGGFNLPGGGFEHGEKIEAALRRELREELNLEAARICQGPHSVLPYYLPDIQKIGIWLVYESVVLNVPPKPNGVTIQWIDKNEMLARTEKGEIGNFLNALFFKRCGINDCCNK